MRIPAQREPSEPTILVVHDGCEGELVTELAFDDGVLRRTGLCLACGVSGVLTVVSTA